MEQKRERFYHSTPLEMIDLEERLEKTLKDVNDFNNHSNNIKK